MKNGSLSFFLAVSLAALPACTSRGTGPVAAVPPAGSGSVPAPQEGGIAAASNPGADVPLQAAAQSVPQAAPQVAPQSAARSGRETANDPAARRYPLPTCAINGQAFRNSPKYRRVYQGQEVLFCCTPCVRAFDTAPEAFMPSILARIEAHQASADVSVPQTVAAR